MIDTSSQPIVDFYPIVVDLDDETLHHRRSSNTSLSRASLYETVASEASWFASERSERSLRLEEENIETQAVATGKEPRESGSPTRRRRKNRNPSSPKSLSESRSRGPSLRHDCDDEWNENLGNSSKKSISDCDDNAESSLRGSVFANFRSLLQLGNHRQHSQKNKSRGKSSMESPRRNSAPENIYFSCVSPVPSPLRVGAKRYRPRRFQDEYVLTQQIVRCRNSTLWECVHRPTGRRYCAKAIDKRRFASQFDRTMAVREITMHRLIHQFSPISCLPRIRHIFADGEAAEQTLQDECKSSESCCSESTRSMSTSSACDDSNWYIVQDFEAGGGNLGLYLLDRENTDSGGTNINNLGEASRGTSNTMSESEVRSLARSLLLALNELHRRSICHNDLCPENILVPFSPTHRQEVEESDLRGKQRGDQQRNVSGSNSYRYNRHRRTQSYHELSDGCWEALKLCDLGRAFFVNDSATNATDDAPRHSKLHYTSPEVLMGKSPSLASDMWSVGVILYRCFAGELPFREQNDDSVHSVYSSTSTSPSSSRGRQLKREICKADINLGLSSRRKSDLRWSRVSRPARQFLSALLNPSSSVRMTCDEALYHPWLMNGAAPSQWSASSSYCSSMSPSSSSPLGMTPIVPSSTSTNHYHHHPKYSTDSHKDKGTDENDDADDGDERDSSTSTRASIGRSRLLVHKILGRLKTNSNKNQTAPKADEDFVVE